MWLIEENKKSMTHQLCGLLKKIIETTKRSSENIMCDKIMRITYTIRLLSFIKEKNNFPLKTFHILFVKSGVQQNNTTKLLSLIKNSFHLVTILYV